MQLLAGYDAAIGEWVAERIPEIQEARFWGPYVALGVINDKGELLAGCIYHNYHPSFGTCDMSIAAQSPKWASRGIIKKLLSVVFDQYGCHRATFNVNANNTRAIRLMKLLGAVKEGAHVGAYGPGKNALTFRMLKKDYKRLFDRS